MCKVGMKWKIGIAAIAVALSANVGTVSANSNMNVDRMLEAYEESLYCASENNQNDESVVESEQIESLFDNIEDILNGKQVPVLNKQQDSGLQLYGALNNQVCSAAIKSNNLYLMNYINRYGKTSNDGSKHIIKGYKKDTAVAGAEIEVVSNRELKYEMVWSERENGSFPAALLYFTYDIESGTTSDMDCSYFYSSSDAIGYKASFSMANLSRDSFGLSFHDFVSTSEKYESVKESSKDLYESMLKVQLLMTQNLLKSEVGFSMADVGFISYDVGTRISHTSIDSSKAATCLAGGYNKKICGLCGKVVVNQNVPVKGHTYSAWNAVDKATVFDKGTMRRRCTVCGLQEEKEVPMLKPVIKLSQSKVTLKVGKSKKIKVKKMAAGDSVDSWKSKDKKIATVKKGKIKAVSKGKTTVTVTLVSGKKAKVKVTVK